MRDTVPGASDSVAIPIGPDDTAFVALFRIRAPSGPIKGLYVLRSRGVSHGGRFSFNTGGATHRGTVRHVAGSLHGRGCRLERHRRAREEREQRHHQRS
jgi:hypothetical protein